MEILLSYGYGSPHDPFSTGAKAHFNPPHGRRAEALRFHGGTNGISTVE
jgi:hypothetical protein